VPEHMVLLLIALVLAFVLALIIGIAGGVLSWMSGVHPAAAILRGGAAFGGVLALAVAVLTLVGP
jgi:hypothetical protein